MTEGASLLLSVLGNPALQKASKVWYLLRAQCLLLMALYLSLSSSSLPDALREQLWAQGQSAGWTALLGGVCGLPCCSAATYADWPP